MLANLEVGDPFNADPSYKISVVDNGVRQSEKEQAPDGNEKPQPLAAG
jgi:hypothetical protein